jgi:hypothetical protein
VCVCVCVCARSRAPAGSTDIYHMDGPVKGWVAQWVQGFYERIIFPNITSEQKVLLVPGAFGRSVCVLCFWPTSAS